MTQLNTALTSANFGMSFSPVTEEISEGDFTDKCMHRHIFCPYSYFWPGQSKRRTSKLSRPDDRPGISPPTDKTFSQSDDTGRKSGLLPGTLFAGRAVHRPRRRRPGRRLPRPTMSRP